MKNIKYLLLMVLTVATVVSCIDEDNDELTGGAITGGLVSLDKELISYVVGSGVSYSSTGNILQGETQTNKIEVYNQLNYQVFLTALDGSDSIVTKQTNKVLLETIDINDISVGLRNNFSLSFAYEDLIRGLTKEDGTSLPTNDGDLSIGDFWELTYDTTTSNGNTNTNSKRTKVALGTRYAGVYEVLESEYWRLGAGPSDWNGTERIIESVNATIYRHKGVGFWDDNEFFFTVDNATNVITIMDVDLDGNGVNLNGQPIMTCESNNGFTVLACGGGSSIATPDDVNGLDELTLTVGYLTAGSGPREFFQRMVKKVD